MLKHCFQGRETYLIKVTLQGKKDSVDYPDNYCFGSIVNGGQEREIIRNESTCLVRNAFNDEGSASNATHQLARQIISYLIIY